MKIVRGDAWLVADRLGDPNSPKHLNVIASNRIPPHDEVLLAPIVSHRYAGQDSSCLIYPGDHPFIIRLSCIDYYKVKRMRVAKLLKHMQPESDAPNQTKRTASRLTTVPYSRVSDDVVQRIHDGFYKSELARDFAFYYLEHPANRR